MGDAASHLLWGAEQLEEILTEVKISSLYSTDPRDDTDQDRFVNCVVSGECPMDPLSVLDFILKLEDERGRRRDPLRPKGPRPLDVDILLWGRRVIDTPRLQVPHPRMNERLFVLIPLLELSPFITEPKTETPYAEVRRTLSPQGIYYFDLTRYIDF